MSIPRRLGLVRGERRGPTVVITGGLHGNEPAGVSAAKDVLERLDMLRDRLCGTVVAFSGNRAALERGARYIERDLNRGWSASELEELGDRPVTKLDTEDREQRELHDEFVMLEQTGDQLIFIDLHTTSGPTAPFVCAATAAESRRLASTLPVSAVVGLEKQLHGTMVSWCTARGHVALSFEAGQHTDPRARERHVAAIWSLLVATTTLEAKDVPEPEAVNATLTAHSPVARSRVVEVRHRHVVRAGDDFEMVGRFESFDPIDAGQIVARDRRGPVRAPEAGLMLMPRYQPQGEDGFFVVRELRR